MGFDAGKRKNLGLTKGDVVFMGAGGGKGRRGLVNLIAF